MTPIEKAETALAQRIERLNAKLRETTLENVRVFLFQSLVASVGLGEALHDYVKMIGQYAKVRYSGIKEANAELIAKHAELLESGNAQLEQLKANPKDRALLKEIEAAQQAMATIQKTLRRGANSLQRDLAPSMAMVENISASIRRLGEADDREGLKRALTMLLENVHALYSTQPDLPNKHIIDAPAWEQAASTAITQATDFYEAYARAGFQALLALDILTMAVSQTPPNTPEEATRRAQETVSARLQTITLRFAAN